MRKVHGGSVNDVILTTVTGGLRAWLMARGTPLGRHEAAAGDGADVLIDDELEATSLGTQIAGHLVSLPIGESSPVVRLHQVSYAFQAHNETGRAWPPTGWPASPASRRRRSTRSAHGWPPEQCRGFHLTVTNVPGPQFPLYAAGARMFETYPVPPLLPGHPLAIGSRRTTAGSSTA